MLIGLIFSFLSTSLKASKARNEMETTTGIEATSRAALNNGVETELNTDPLDSDALERELSSMDINDEPQSDNIKAEDDSDMELDSVEAEAETNGNRYSQPLDRPLLKAGCNMMRI